MMYPDYEATAGGQSTSKKAGKGARKMSGSGSKMLGTSLNLSDGAHLHPALGGRPSLRATQSASDVRLVVAQDSGRRRSAQTSARPTSSSDEALQKKSASGPLEPPATPLSPGPATHQSFHLPPPATHQSHKSPKPGKDL